MLFLCTTTAETFDNQNCHGTPGSKPPLLPVPSGYVLGPSSPSRLVPPPSSSVLPGDAAMSSVLGPESPGSAGGGRSGIGASSDDRGRQAGGGVGAGGGCRRVIEAAEGQRINITLLDFGMSLSFIGF